MEVFEELDVLLVELWTEATHVVMRGHQPERPVALYEGVHCSLRLIADFKISIVPVASKSFTSCSAYSKCGASNIEASDSATTHPMLWHRGGASSLEMSFTCCHPVCSW